MGAETKLGTTLDGSTCSQSTTGMIPQVPQFSVIDVNMTARVVLAVAIHRWVRERQQDATWASGTFVDCSAIDMHTTCRKMMVCWRQVDRPTSDHAFESQGLTSPSCQAVAEGLQKLLCARSAATTEQKLVAI